jgi:5'(3')-deoxyribonucleotidase
VGDVSEVPICILTGPTKDPECLAGKYEWITTVLPPYLHRQYLIGPRKQFCAHPEALLIDDSDDNVKAFRGAGGHAILVPRPWNSLHALNTTEYLQREFGRYLDLQLS